MIASDAANATAAPTAVEPAAPVAAVAVPTPAEPAPAVATAPEPAGKHAKIVFNAGAAVTDVRRLVERMHAHGAPHFPCMAHAWLKGYGSSHAGLGPHDIVAPS